MGKATEADREGWKSKSKDYSREEDKMRERRGE
jgi:hypothetical protein